MCLEDIIFASVGSLSHSAVFLTRLGLVQAWFHGEKWAASDTKIGSHLHPYSSNLMPFELLREWEKAVRELLRAHSYVKLLATTRKAQPWACLERSLSAGFEALTMARRHPNTAPVIQI